MKYTICGFYQPKMVEFEMDLVDAQLLRYFIDFKDTGKMITEIFDNKLYYWIKYESVIEELPIAKLKNKDSVYRRFRKLSKIGMLDHRTRKDKQGTYSFYAVGDNYKYLISNSDELEGSRIKIRTRTDEKSEQKILLLNNPSTKKEFRDVSSKSLDTIYFFDFIKNLNAEEYNGEKHTSINYFLDKQLEETGKVNEKFTYGTWYQIYDHWFKAEDYDIDSVEDVYTMIDDFFNTKFKNENCNYSIVLFDRTKEMRYLNCDLL